jgi:hypothetical protein
VYENDEGVRLAQNLAKVRGMSVSGLYRDLVRNAARRAGMSDGQDLSQAAEEMRDYYANDPEVRAWVETDVPLYEYPDEPKQG